MSATMQAVVLHGKEDARLEQVPVPGVGPGEVRVRIATALTCGTDLKVFRRGYHARMIVPPAIFGHEFAGTIDAVGPEVDGWQVGDRVVAANSAPCGDCFFCENSREELCEDLLFLNGAYAEFITVPARIVRKNLLRVPDTLPLAAAALVEPLACAVHGVEETGVREGESVVILGAGPLGLLLARCAALRGAEVFVLGRRLARLEAARAMGAAETVDVEVETDLSAWVRARTYGRGADRVIEAVGRPEAWEQALRLVRKGGTVNLFGGCPAGTAISIDTGRLHYDALTVLGSFHHTPRAIRTALDLLAAERIPWQTLVQREISLAEFAEALPHLVRGGGPLKAAVIPEPLPHS